MHFTQWDTLSDYPTTGRAYFGHPSGGFFFVRDLRIADCQFPLTLRVAAFGPGVDGFLGGWLPFGIFILFDLYAKYTSHFLGMLNYLSNPLSELL